MVSQRQSGNTKMRKWKGIEAYQDVRLITGLHLHGLNCSTKEFITLPPTTINAFASSWGFIQMPSIVLDTIPEIKTFTDKMGDTGIWNAEAIEGFVVHTHLVDYPLRESVRDATP